MFNFFFNGLSPIFVKNRVMRKFLIIFTILLVIGFGLKCFFIRPANKEVTTKLFLIESELKSMGYRPIWFMISGRRDKLLTKLSYNNLKSGSPHLLGIAIDIEVIDIDGDFDFDEKDINLFLEANSRVEKQNPNLRGAVGTYRGPNSDWLEWHQIHIDTKGISKRYNKRI